MSDEQKTTQVKCCTPAEGLPLAAMMEKMMGRLGQDCDCMEMMSQMMGACCGSQAETETGPQSA